MVCEANEHNSQGIVAFSSCNFVVVYVVWKSIFKVSSSLLLIPAWAESYKEVRAAHLLHLFNNV